MNITIIKLNHSLLSFFYFFTYPHHTHTISKVP